MTNGTLVMKVVKEYQNHELTEDELVEAGFEGLKKAAKKYHEKVKPNYNFKSYAVWWIHVSILQAIKSKK